MDNVIGFLRDLKREVLTRADWETKHESLYQQRRIDKPTQLPALYAFSHISVTVDNGRTRDDFISDMLELERIGYERFGSGISYNWAVDMQTGMIGQGQPLDAKGTHTVNDKGVAGFPYNLNLYGHAIVGIGMPGDGVSLEFIRSVAAILRAEQDAGVMNRDINIHPHSMFANKDCPTEAIRIRLPYIRDLAKTLKYSEALTMSEAAGINANIDEFERKEDNRYARYEAIHREQMTAIASLQTAINLLIQAIKAQNPPA